MALLDKISWPIVIVLCLTLGLAPFTPEPHIWEKLRMLVAGDLRRPVDIFDMLFHGLPWLVALAKGLRQVRQS
ncbi:MAG: RND transporter [Paracoccaceae bacterium]|jgi:hypothetical protein|nr:RND transporter [Paracoccaceae bacterium]